MICRHITGGFLSCHAAPRCHRRCFMDSEEVRLAHGAVSSLTAGTGYSTEPAGISRENSPVGFRKAPRSGIGFEGFGVS